MHQYRYCPRCGAALRPGTERGAFACTGCGRPFFENSKPCAGALVERDGRVLLVRRGIEPYKGWWDVPGGFLEPGEHPAAGAAREVLEETGLVVEVGELLGIWVDTYGSGDELAYTLNCHYVARVVGGAERAADDAVELAWFGPDELPPEIAFEHQPAVLAAWRRVHSRQHARRSPMAVPTTPTETYGNRFLEPGSRSAQLFERARQLLPGGNTRTTVFTQPHPIYMAEGSGCSVTDADGQARLDFLNNYTSLLHGHGHPEVIAAAQAQVARGTAFAGPTELEIDLAEIIVARVPAIERIRFTNSGSEAVMMAIKAARGYTGRPKLAKFEGFYHGTYDPAEVSVTPTVEAGGSAAEPTPVSETAGLAPGTLENTVVLPYNDRAAVERILEREAPHLAAVIVDPLANGAGFPEPDPEFLRFLRDVTRRHGILLIADEIISFRIGYQGASAHFGFTPDLVTLGKIIGGGFPVGAVGGSAEVMSVFDPTEGRPRVPHGGTFNANPVTMAAGAAAMRLWTEAAVARLERLGDDLRERANWILDESGLAFKLTGQGSLFRIMPKAADRDYRSGLPDAQGAAQRRDLHLRLLGAGILTSPTGLGCLSTPMGEEQVTAVVEALRTSATAMAG